MLFLGVFDQTGAVLSPVELEQLRTAVSRRSDDAVLVKSGKGFAMAAVQDAAFGRAVAIRSEPRLTGMVLGRAYLDPEAEHDADALLLALQSNDVSGLRRARGSFCAWVLDPDGGAVRFCTDKVGVYPIFLARVGQRVYFSTAMRMLKALPGVCGDLNPAGLFTALSFGYPLGTQTVFSNVERMYGGEVIEVDRVATTAHRRRYWSWSEVSDEQGDANTLERQIHEAFMDAVRLRAEADAPGDLSFLSGGLDSRCIAGALASLKRTVWTLNFAPEGSQDHMFGQLVARALGTHHHELGLNQGSFPQRQREILESWAQAHRGEVSDGARPFRVWSGDGGSVGLGHVYLDQRFVQLLRSGDLVAACRHFMDKGKKVVPTGMLRLRYKEQANSAPLNSMVEELKSFICRDPGKAGFLFLLLNDQRHHLADYFENADLHRFELVLPFFDARLLELVVTAPLDPFLGHHFYNAWLHHFPEGVASVPWQSYPGHAPCPIPADQFGALRYQWKEDWFDEAESRKRRAAAEAGWQRMLDGGEIPDAVANRMLLRAALWLTQRGIRDYRYVLNSAQQMAAFTSMRA